MANDIQSGNLVGGAGSVVFADRHSYVQIENNDSANGLWVTTDGSEAVVGADDVDVIPPGGTTLLANGLGWYYQGYSFDGTGTNPGTVINLASSSDTAAYSVMGV